MVAQSPLYSSYLSHGVVVGYIRQVADKERRWPGLTLIELMVAMAVVAIATFERVEQ
jgi:prepilin-type N-terminal cleavage/methylation domain-containing protein